MDTDVRVDSTVWRDIAGLFKANGLGEGGYQILSLDQLKLMMVTGPSTVQQFHINPSPEVLYQIVGTVQIEIASSGIISIVQLNAGDLMLIPAMVPHRPVRASGTLGLVVERAVTGCDVDRSAYLCEEFLARNMSQAGDCASDVAGLVRKENPWIRLRQF